jgi:hypothetical protein
MFGYHCGALRTVDVGRAEEDRGRKAKAIGDELGSVSSHDVGRR